MNYQRLSELRDMVRIAKEKADSIQLNNFDKNFSLDFTHNSTAIEGNTLTINETKLLLEDKISIGGKALREIYEVTNHNKAYEYVREKIKEGCVLDEAITKDIHSILMENIMAGGIYRNQNVYISGSRHTPPEPTDMYYQIKTFFDTLSLKKNEYNDIEFAAYTHAEFVRVHPYIDGNGRTSRLIMNYQLMLSEFLPISIQKEQRLEYYDALEEYSVNQSLESFTEMVAKLEEEQLEKLLKFL